MPGSSASENSPAVSPEIWALIQSLPKAELHLHLEGSIAPPIAAQLAARHGVSVTEHDVSARYAPGDFAQFLDAFKWVTSFLRAPADYALVTTSLAEALLAQNLVYAEITLSVGVMLLRKQDPLANFAAIREAAAPFESRGLHINWIFDAVRQFGVPAAREVARLAIECKRARPVETGVVAFGIGGDETALPASDFASIYDSVAAAGLGRLIHAGEIGPASAVRDAVEILGVSRVGHGIAAMHDPLLMDFLASRRVALEFCPTSNLRTGALARQLGAPAARAHQHPLASFFRRGVPITLSTDDPAMFEISLNAEYALASRLGLSAPDLIRLAESSFDYAFLPAAEKQRYLQSLRATAAGIL